MNCQDCPNWGCLAKVRCLVIGRGVLKVDILLGIYELGIEELSENGPKVAFY